MRPEICFSCPHHSTNAGHPSGESDFCSQSQSGPPGPLYTFPLKCNDHPDPEHQPAGRSGDTQGLQSPEAGFDPPAPCQPDTELDFRLKIARKRHRPGGVLDEIVDITQVKADGERVWYSVTTYWDPAAQCHWVHLSFNERAHR